MWYHWHSTLTFLIVVLLAYFARAAVHWDEMLVKHTWNAVPANWECLGNATAGAIIKLHIALKPDRESALVDALSEVSNPKHPRHVLLTTPPLVLLFTRAAPFQIWRISFSRAGCSACQPACRHCQPYSCLAYTSRHTTLLHLNVTRRLLADGHRRARVPGQSTPRRVIPAIPTFEDERHDNPHGRLRAPCGTAYTHSNCRAHDILPL